MKKIGIIPARLGSSRFPGKPMEKILGMPMVGHCFLRAKMAEVLDEVIVATCDETIYRYIEEDLGGRAIMTADTHERASDRVAEALLNFEAESDTMFDIVVMLQGDEPMVTPKMINEAVEPLLIDDSNIGVVNLMTDIGSTLEFEDPNEVKVVVDRSNDAVYFSREPIPSAKKYDGKMPMLKQVCVIPFRREVLLEFNSFEQTPLEIIESIDMLRFLENGLKVRMVYSDQPSFSVDTPMDLERVSRVMEGDPLVDGYLAL